MFHKYFIKEIKGCSSSLLAIYVFLEKKWRIHQVFWYISFLNWHDCLTWVCSPLKLVVTACESRRSNISEAPLTPTDGEHFIAQMIIEYQWSIPFMWLYRSAFAFFFSVTGFLFQNISVCAAAMRQTLQVKILHDTGVTVSKICSVEIRRLVIRCVYRTRCYWDGVVLICFCLFRPYFCFFLLFPPLSFPSATLSPTITFIYLFCTCCLFSPYVVNECVWPCQAAHFKSPVTVCIIEARLH